MYEIDYSKWYYSHVFFFCVKKLEKDDIRTEVVKIPKGFRFYNRVKLVTTRNAVHLIWFFRVLLSLCSYLLLLQYL